MLALNAQASLLARSTDERRGVRLVLVLWIVEVDLEDDREDDKVDRHHLSVGW